MASTKKRKHRKSPKRKRSDSDIDNEGVSNQPKRRKTSHISPAGDSKKNEFRSNIAEQRTKISISPKDYPFDESRIMQSHDEPSHGVPVSTTRITGVVYWMQRDQRVQDNWAMIYAQKMALQHKVSLSVVFCLLPTSASATLRHFDFMMKGLQQVEQE